MAVERGYRQCVPLLARVLQALLVALSQPLLNAHLPSLTGLLWRQSQHQLDKQ